MTTDIVNRLNHVILNNVISIQDIAKFLFSCKYGGTSKHALSLMIEPQIRVTFNNFNSRMPAVQFRKHDFWG